MDNTKYFPIISKGLRSLILLCIFLLCSTQIIAQSSSDSTIQTDTAAVLVGEFQRAELQVGDFGTIFRNEYQNYEVDVETIRNLENSVYKYSIVIVLATWCHDTHVQVPRFYRILDELDYETSYIKNICLDRKKLADGIDISKLNIDKVPTFIFFDGDKEIGRIVETPQISLEKDTYQLLSK